MYLGVEIGGTKLQLGVGRGDGAPLEELARFEVDAALGAQGILDTIAVAAADLIARYPVAGIGVGFGGPIDSVRGQVKKSHHVAGWEDFPLVKWLGDRFDLPAKMGNDADLAGLAEAKFGSGRGFNPVFYVTVGTGIGGGLIVGGQVYAGNLAGAAELGHLRPGLGADRADRTIESVASGLGIAAAAQDRVAGPRSHRLGTLRAGYEQARPEVVRQRLIEQEACDDQWGQDLLTRAGGSVDDISAKIVAEAARAGNALAQETLRHAWLTLGWGIAQMITLMSPARVVIGGGVALMGEELMFEPLREAVDRYVFPPFLGTFELVPAKLGEEMVVHGALALAASNEPD